MKQRVEILQNKSKCRLKDTTKKIYIDRVKNPFELLVEHNSRMLLKAMGHTGMRVAGNSRIIAVGDNTVRSNHNKTNQSSQAVAQGSSQSSQQVPPEGSAQHNAGVKNGQKSVDPNASATPRQVPTTTVSGTVTSTATPSNYSLAGLTQGFVSSLSQLVSVGATATSPANEATQAYQDEYPEPAESRNGSPKVHRNQIQNKHHNRHTHNNPKPGSPIPMQELNGEDEEGRKGGKGRGKKR